MGKVVYHWDDHRHNAFDDLPLHLTAIAGNDSFFYSISEPDGRTCAVKGFETEEKYHLFNNPLGYLDQLVADDVLLCADFARAVIAIRGVPFTILGNMDISEQEVLQKLSRMSDTGVQDTLLMTPINEELQVAYAVPETFIREARAWFSNAG